MGIQNQTIDFNSSQEVIEYNEAWTVRDENEYRREYADWLDHLQLDDDGIPY